MPCNFERGVRPSIGCVETAAHCQTWVRRPAETVVRFVECDRATSSHARFIGPGVFLDADLDRKRTIPNRIGYAGSDGYLARPYRTHESHGGCNTQDYETAGRLVADQIRPVAEELIKLPFVDSGRVAVMGHSGGGLGAIALTKDRPSWLRGVISAAGARGGVCANGEYTGGHFYNQHMIVAYHNYGLKARTPVLMLYAENDPRTVRAESWRGAYVGAGGVAELVVLPRQPRSGHSVGRWNPADWIPPASRFLKHLGLPPLEQ